MTRHQSTGRLVGVSDIAMRFGVTRHTAWVWTKRPGCPPAYDTAGTAAVWLAEDIEPWLQAAGQDRRRHGPRLSPTTIGTLVLLRDRGEPTGTPEVLAAFPGEKKGTIYTVLNRLTRRGHVRCTRHEGNRRRSLYEITAEGLAELERENAR